MLSRQLYRSLFAVIVSTAVLSAATVVAMKLPTPRGSFLPASFITHSMMLVLSVVAILLISKRCWPPLRPWHYRVGKRRTCSFP